MINEIYIVDALRTPVGNLNGSLSSLPASQLGAIVIKEIIKKNQIKPNEISEVILGQVLVGNCGQNPARQAAINAGLPNEIPAWNVSQVCGSGLKAISLGFQSILAGDADIVIAGGQESMSQASHAIHMRNGIKMGDANLTDMMIKDGLMDVFNNYHMGITAENLAKKYNISREEQDQFACISQNKAEKAQNSGIFNSEIVPVEVQVKKEKIIISKDEFIKPDTTINKLLTLRPAFAKDGTVTAGNASGVNDGAAVVLMMNKQKLDQYGLKPMAKIVSWAQAGVDPSIMGIGPVFAIKKALQKANWQISDLELIEANEAFAAQAISVNKELNWDINKVNVNGGSIAIGHPIGASGARITVTLLHEMRRRGAKKAAATLCIGGGMGISMCIAQP